MPHTDPLPLLPSTSFIDSACQLFAKYTQSFKDGEACLAAERQYKSVLTRSRIGQKKGVKYHMSFL